MNKNIMVTAFILLFTITVGSAFAEPPEIEHVNKINKNALKKFRYEKTGKESFSLRLGLTKPYSGITEEAAKAFIKENHRLFKVSEELSELKLKSISPNRPNEYFVEFQQNYQGVPINRASIKIEIDGENRIKAAGSSITSIEHLNVPPVIKPGELQDVLKRTAPEFGPIEGEPELSIYAIENKPPILIYKIKTKILETNEPYFIIVDSSNGKVIEKILGRLY